MASQRRQWPGSKHLGRDEEYRDQLRQWIESDATIDTFPELPESLCEQPQ